MGDSIPITLPVARESSAARKDRLTLPASLLISCQISLTSSDPLRFRFGSIQILFFFNLKLIDNISNPGQFGNFNELTPRADPSGTNSKELESL